MATFGVDNFLGEVSFDGSVANFHFTDPDDVKNVQDVSVSAKEFPEGVVSADSREVSDYAYSLVAEKMNAVRSERIKAAEVKLVTDEQDHKKVEASISAQHLATAQDNKTPSSGTETREDGVRQTVYNVGPAVKSEEKKK
jgi:hypothetical protein